MPAKFGGSCDAGYEPVEALFRQHFADGREDNAQLCVYVDGKRVIDLWGSAAGEEDYDGDVLHTVYRYYTNSKHMWTSEILFKLW